MKLNNLSSYLRLSILGAVDGLLFGVAIEILRRIYTPIFVDYYLWRELEEAPVGAKIIPSITRLMGGYFDIPLLCFLAFAAITPLIHIYLRKHFQSSTVLWQFSGMVAATVVVLIHDSFTPFGHDT